MLQKQPDEPPSQNRYWLRTKRDKETELKTTRHECLAVLLVILLIRLYLDSNGSNFQTDHKSLNWLLSVSDSSRKLARCRLPLWEFQFDIVYPGDIKQQAATSVSRLLTDRSHNTNLNDDILELAKTMNITSTDKIKQYQDTWKKYEEPSEQEFNRVHLTCSHMTVRITDLSETDSRNWVWANMSNNSPRISGSQTSPPRIQKQTCRTPTFSFSKQFDDQRVNNLHHPWARTSTLRRILSQHVNMEEIHVIKLLYFLVKTFGAGGRLMLITGLELLCMRPLHELIAGIDI